MAPFAHRDPLTKTESREAAEYLLDGAPIGSNTPLAVAAAVGYTGAVEMLLRDPRVDPADPLQGARALVLACRNGRDAIVPLLLRDPRVDVPRAATAALRAARRHGSEHLVAMLLRDPRVRAHAGDDSDHEERGDDGGAHPLSRRRRRRRRHRLGPLVPEASFGAASAQLVAAAAQGRAGRVRRLLRDPVVDPASGDSRALRVAAVGGHDRVVMHLIEDGRADPAARNSEALRAAAILGHASIVRMLLRDGRADPTASGAEIVFRSRSHSVRRALRREPRLAWYYYEGRGRGVGGAVN